MLSFLIFLCLSAFKISCSAGLSMKKNITSGPVLLTTPLLKLMLFKQRRCNSKCRIETERKKKIASTVFKLAE